MHLVASLPVSVLNIQLTFSQVENLEMLSIRLVHPKETELKVVEKPRAGILSTEKKCCPLLFTLREVVWDNILKQNNGRNSTQNLNSSKNQPTELSRQATEKRKYSALGCFFPYAGRLSVV